MTDIVKFISLGAGVQSTTLALMAAHGEFGDNAPKVAIFADTGWEPTQVYKHLDWLEKELDKYGIKVLRATRGNIREDFLRFINGEGRSASIPFFTKDPKNPNGKEGMLWRQCTKEYKIDVVRRAMREYLGYGPRQRVKEKIELWMGISTDEIFRAKSSTVQYITNRYPLLDRNMSRNDCLRWMKNNGYPMPPKSSCIGCPYRSDNQWIDLKENYPEDFADAVDFDRKIREKLVNGYELYVHRSCKPLDEVDFYEKSEQGSLDFFDNECEGMCGI